MTKDIEHFSYLYIIFVKCLLKSFPLLEDFFLSFIVWL